MELSREAARDAVVSAGYAVVGNGRELETGWHFEVREIGTIGVIVSKAKRRCTPIGSVMQACDAQWAYDVGLFRTRFANLTIDAVHDRSRAADQLEQLQLVHGGRLNSGGVMTAREHRSLLATPPVRYRNQGLLSALSSLRSLEEHAQVTYDADSGPSSLDRARRVVLAPDALRFVAENRSSHLDLMNARSNRSVVEFVTLEAWHYGAALSDSTGLSAKERGALTRLRVRLAPLPGLAPDDDPYETPSVNHALALCNAPLVVTEDDSIARAAIDLAMDVWPLAELRTEVLRR